MSRWVLVCDQASQPDVNTDTGTWNCPTLVTPFDGVSGPKVMSLEEAVASSLGSGLPPANDVAAVWSAGFSLVVVCFAIGRVAGVCLELIRKG